MVDLTSLGKSGTEVRSLVMLPGVLHSTTVEPAEHVEHELGQLPSCAHIRLVTTAIAKKRRANIFVSLGVRPIAW